MPGIQDFKAHMIKGFARPNIFKVVIDKSNKGVQERFSLNCFQAQIPGNTIATTDKDIGLRSVTYQKIFSDVVLGFYVGGELRELKFWQAWIDDIVDNRTNQHAYYKDYVGNVQITQGNRQQEPVATWTLHDAYPKQVDPISLDYSTNNAVMTMNVTLTYRNFKVKWHPAGGGSSENSSSDIDIHQNNTNSDLNQTQKIINNTIEPTQPQLTQPQLTAAQIRERTLAVGGGQPGFSSDTGGTNQGGAFHSVPEPTAD